MIFKPILIRQVLTGAKTVTRRPVKSEKPCRYEAGREYSIAPGMARPSIGRIRIVSVRSEELGDIDDADAVLEGFPDAAAFRAYWRALYGGMWDCGLPVWRIEFELVEKLGLICGCCGGVGMVELSDPMVRAATT